MPAPAGRILRLAVAADFCEIEDAFDALTNSTGSLGLFRPNLFQHFQY
jgi:hypothetical protein